MHLSTERSIDCHHSWWGRVERLAAQYGWTGERTVATEGDCFSADKYSDASAASLKAALEAALPGIPPSSDGPRDPKWELSSQENLFWGLAGTQEKLQDLIRFLAGGAFKLYNNSCIVQDPLIDFRQIYEESLDAARHPSRRTEAERLIGDKRELGSDPATSPVGMAFQRLLEEHLRVHVGATVASNDAMAAVLEQTRLLLIDYHESAFVAPLQLLDYDNDKPLVAPEPPL